MKEKDSFFVSFVCLKGYIVAKGNNLQTIGSKNDRKTREA
jgi:hypothetical protein